MDLKIKDVAERLNVSEKTIRRWLSEGKIPAYKLNREYRFSRSEIEDWVMSCKIKKGHPAPFGEKQIYPLPESAASSQQRLGIQQYSLYRAMHKGGVLTHIKGKNKEEVIRSAVTEIASSLNLDKDVITELLLHREKLMPTALNNGIAVPHTRDFLLDERYDVVVTAFLEEPIQFGALDGKPVHTLFFLFSCEDKRHLHLLAKLAHLSSEEKALDLFSKKLDREELLDFVKQWESQISTI